MRDSVSIEQTKKATSKIKGVAFLSKLTNH